jgi:NAD kinase
LARASRDWVDFDDADYVIALGGDGFMLQTLHRMLERRRGPVPVLQIGDRRLGRGGRRGDDRPPEGLGHPPVTLM